MAKRLINAAVTGKVLVRVTPFLVLYVIYSFG